MPVQKTIPYNLDTFFITFTCYKWITLIEKTNSYDLVYNWFDILKGKGHYINGYVIMPNHIHVMITFSPIDESINAIIGNGKRFMAYQIIKRLSNNKEVDILFSLSENIEAKRKSNNNKHNVWELSFDWKKCDSNEFADQKLDYMHLNPCRSKVILCQNPEDYVHSSARFYFTGSQRIYDIKSFPEMQDVKLLRSKY